jgi:hypothetical protein
MQPGKSGKLTPKALPGSWWMTAMYFIVASASGRSAARLRADRDVLHRVRNNHQTGFDRVTENVMVAVDSDLLPPVAPQQAHHVPAMHAARRSMLATIW